MKIIATGDTHGRFPKLPEGDVLVHTGDGTLYGSLSNVRELDNWFGSLDYKHIIYVPGNHDFCFAEGAGIKNAHVLINKEIVIDGVKFWGSPFSRRLGAFVFMREDADLERIWELIPEDVDILITHGPPYGILDWSIRQDHAGSKTLMERVDKVKPTYHLFGHIHEGAGISIQNGIVFRNVSYVNEFYQPANDPIVIDYEIFGSVARRQSTSLLN